MKVELLVSGILAIKRIVHILSFIDSIDLEKKFMFNNELEEFIKNLNQEYKNKTEMKIL